MHMHKKAFHSNKQVTHVIYILFVVITVSIELSGCHKYSIIFHTFSFSLFCFLAFFFCLKNKMLGIDVFNILSVSITTSKSILVKRQPVVQQSMVRKCEKLRG